MSDTVLGPPRIVDVVFGGRRRGGRTHAALALAVTLVMHLALFSWAAEHRPGLDAWAEDMAELIHQKLSNDHVIEMAPPPPPRPPEPVRQPERAQPSPPREQVKAPVVQKSATPPPPAQAGQVIAQDPDAPLDLSAATFVTGKGSAYTGGRTTSSGTSKTAVTRPVEQREKPPPPQPKPVVAPVVVGPDLSGPVHLSEDDWSCAWPREADRSAIDEQSAIIRVTVRSDGLVQKADLLFDPGYGFGAAALACARRARFQPAHDREGHAIDATSPPIRVHFYR